MKKGKYKFFKSWFSEKKVNAKTPINVIIIWAINLNLKDKPEEFLNFTFL